MTYRIPGSKPWVQTTMAVTQKADWEEGMGAGVIRYDDGTLWVWNTEMAHPSQDYEFTGYTVTINELAPGSKAWEQLTPDSWSTDSVSVDVGSSGRLVETNMQTDHWMVANDGGDLTYWFPWAGLENAPTITLESILIVNKATRTWEHKPLGDSMSVQTAPVLWGGYLWFFGGGSLDTNVFLYRMSIVSPYPVEKAKTFTNYRSTLWDLDPDTNLPNFFSKFALGRYGENLLGVDDDGYLYWLTNDYLLGSYGSESKGVAVIKRMLLPDGEFETIYYYYVPSNTIKATNFTYNLPRGERNDQTSGPMPIGLGMRPKWYDSAKIRDGYLYFVDASTFMYGYRGAGWLGGFMFQRLDLSLVEDGWVEHQPESPIVEVLSMTTAPEDSFYNWDDNDYWGTRGGHDWRDGLDAIHAFPEPNWQFDTDGSIIFLHHEYPSWLAQPNDWYPPYVLSRLSPPENIPITFNLVFEGNELKGYGHVRQVPAKTNIGTIELTGE